MAETYGFFNSADNDTRIYSADDFAGLFGMLFTDGVCGDRLALSAYRNVFTVSIAAGGALIDGFWYRNTAAKTLTITPPTTTIYGRIILRLNKNTRRIVLMYRKGTSSAPPALVNDGTYHDIPIAGLLVAPSAIISVTDERQFITIKGGNTNASGT